MLIVGCKVKVLADQKKVKDFCDRNPNLAEWSDKRAACCGKGGTIVEEDEEDWTLQIRFEDGFESWFPRTAVTFPDGSFLPVGKLDDAAKAALLRRDFSIKRFRTAEGNWESLGLITGIGGRPWQTVDSVRPGLSGDRAGIKAGMTLHAINGNNVSNGTWPQFKEALLKAGGQFTLTVFLPDPEAAKSEPAAPDPHMEKSGSQSPQPAAAPVVATQDDDDDDDEDSDEPGIGPAMPNIGPSGPEEAAIRAAEEEAKAAQEAAEEAAKMRSKQASVNALSSALMRRFGQQGRLYHQGLVAFFETIGNTPPTRHEYRHCCAAYKGDAKNGLGLEFLGDMLEELPEDDEVELQEVAREVAQFDGPSWEPPPHDIHTLQRMVDDRKRWLVHCPRCGYKVGCDKCPQGLGQCPTPPRAVVIGDSHARELSELLANFVTSNGQYAFRVDAAPIVGASAQGLINPNSRTRARQKYLEAVTSRGSDGSSHIDYLFIMIGSVDFDSVLFHKRDKKDSTWWYPQQMFHSASAVEKFLTRDIDFGRVGKVVVVAIHPPPVEKDHFFDQLNKGNHRNDEKEAGDRLDSFHATMLPELSERTRQAFLFNQELIRIVMEVNKMSATAKESESRCLFLSIWDHLIDPRTSTVFPQYRRSNRTDTHLRFETLAELYAGAIRKTLGTDCVTTSDAADTQESHVDKIEAVGELARPSEVRVVGGGGSTYQPPPPSGPPPSPAGDPAAKRQRVEGPESPPPPPTPQPKGPPAVKVPPPAPVDALD